MKFLFIPNKTKTSNLFSCINPHEYIIEESNYDNLFNLSLSNYDSVILDRNSNNLNIIHQIRTINKKIPIIVLLDKCSNQDKFNAKENGNIICVNYPYSQSKYNNAFKQVKAHKNYKETIVFGNTTLSNKKLTLSTPFASVNLTKQEYYIISLLMQAEDQLYTSEEIFCHIWGYYSDCDFSIVWVYLTYIRKKLIQIKSNVSIKVIRNKGYYLKTN